jgi:hypothetical protein
MNEMSTLDTLNKVLGKVQNNRANVAQQLAASNKVLGNATPEVLDAIDLLTKFYGDNPQVIGQTISAKLQIAQMEDMLVEIDAMTAALQVTLSDDTTIEATTALIVKGATDLDPLSDAAGDSPSQAADVSAPAESPAAPAETAVEGASDASAPVDGATA